MIDKICETITKKISKENPDFDEARLEVINYGLQLIIGEIPKMFLAIALAFILGVGKYTLITLVCLIPYRGFTGGFHLKTHIGCFICTTAMYCIPGVLAKYLPIIGNYKYISIALLFIFAIIMISIYAPADTINLPILTKKERKTKKILSYITMIISLTIALVINNTLISSILIYTILLQTISITRPAYKISRCEYGYSKLKAENNLV